LNIVALRRLADDIADRQRDALSTRGEAVFVGGVPAVKSAALLSVSVHPFAARSAAVVFESVGAAAPSKKFAPP
jgi:hypothetical protein